MKIFVLIITALFSLYSMASSEVVATCTYGMYGSRLIYEFTINYNDQNDRVRVDGLPRRDNLEQRVSPVYGSFMMEKGYGGFGKGFIQLGEMNFESDDGEYVFELKEDFDDMGYFYGTMTIVDSLGEEFKFFVECSNDE